MKKYVALFFLGIYTVSSPQMMELLKLPILVEHLIEHKQQDPSLNIFGFLYMHYAQGSPKDADYDKDMKLPFKTFNNTASSHHFYCSANPLSEFHLDVFSNGKDNKFSAYTFIHSSSFLSSIWQPPKYC